MGHISVARIKHMVKWGQLQGIDVLTGTPSFCEACVLGKMKKLPFELLEQPRATQALQMVHTDVRDDFCHFPWIYFMKHKNEALQIYNHWKVNVQMLFHMEVRQETFSDAYMDFIQSDRGGECVNQAF
ncbi:hypothetical protein PAXRUDRAFT_22206 [Paxillus rubicundulus Ve08.2h10]|uniref:GAG-pre-integrase domain-containing protein n=1 Tax=Paxillus rubicundulus Ve08.2h10 TaxID=930991 RepID=A0A0D0C9C6_9AGAM|nr:hypothetical protein PAXRUDRAFT_22206 [Paxillus rubicundulus Ve08.2h10]